MKARVWSLLFALLLAPSAQAVRKDRCVLWLANSALNRDTAVEGDLYAAFDSFRLSSHRNNPENYQHLLDTLDQLDGRLCNSLRDLESTLRLFENAYYSTYGLFHRLNPLGAAWTFHREHLKPLKVEKLRIEAARIAIAKIRVAAIEHSARLPADALILEAQLLFNIAEQHLMTASSTALTATLIGDPGDLNVAFEEGHGLFQQFLRKYTSEVSARLATTLLALGQTNDLAIRKIEQLFEKFQRGNTPGTAAALAAMAFRNGLTADTADPMAETFRNFIHHTQLLAGDVLPLMEHFVRARKMPSEAEVMALESARTRIYRRPGVDGFTSTFLLSVLMSAGGMPISETEIQKVMELYARFLEGRMTSRSAAILAAGTYLTGGDEERATEAKRIWRQLFWTRGIRNESAAAFTFKILLAEYGVQTNVSPDPWAAPENLAIDSPLSRQVDPVQGVITGTFFNMDDNPMTAF